MQPISQINTGISDIYELDNTITVLDDLLDVTSGQLVWTWGKRVVVFINSVDEFFS